MCTLPYLSAMLKISQKKLTAFSGVEGEFLPLTPQFVVSKVNFSHQHFIFWCPSKKFSSAPNISLIGAKTVMVWGKKGIWKTLWIMEFFGIMGKRKLFQAIPCYSSLHFESHFSVPLLFFTSFLLIVVQKNLLFRRDIGIQNFSGPRSYSFKRNRNYSFTLIPLKGKECHNLPEF